MSKTLGRDEIARRQLVAIDRMRRLEAEELSPLHFFSVETRPENRWGLA
jgi:hypothetical protein